MCGDMCGAHVRSHVMCGAHVAQHVRGHVRVRVGLFGFHVFVCQGRYPAGPRLQSGATKMPSEGGGANATRGGGLTPEPRGNMADAPHACSRTCHATCDCHMTCAAHMRSPHVCAHVKCTELMATTGYKERKTRNLKIGRSSPFFWCYLLVMLLLAFRTLFHRKKVRKVKSNVLPMPKRTRKSKFENWRIRCLKSTYTLSRVYVGCCTLLQP